MALRILSTTRGAMFADAVNLGRVPLGCVTLFTYLRMADASQSFRLLISGLNQARLILYGNLANGPLFAASDDAGIFLPVTFPGYSLPLNAWAPVALVFSNEPRVNSLRFAVLRPGLLASGPTTPFTSFPSFSAMRYLIVGRDTPAFGGMYQADYSHVALWNERLGDAELTELMAGENPLAVRRAALLGYWPLERDGRNLVQPAAPLRQMEPLGPVWVDGPARIAKPALGRVYYRRTKAPSSVVGLAFAGSLAGATAAAAATRQAQRIAMREAGFLALQRTLAAAFPAMPLERNRRAPIDDREELPRMVLRDGGHEASTDDTVEEGLYTVTATVEAYAKGGDDAELGQTLNELHAGLVAALVGREILIDLERRTTWPVEDSLELDDAPASQAEYHIGALYLSLRFELRWPIGTGPFSTI